MILNLLLALALWTLPAQASDSISITRVVNGSPITSFDVKANAGVIKLLLDRGVPVSTFSLKKQSNKPEEIATNLLTDFALIEQARCRQKKSALNESSPVENALKARQNYLAEVEEAGKRELLKDSKAFNNLSNDELNAVQLFLGMQAVAEASLEEFIPPYQLSSREAEDFLSPEGNYEVQYVIFTRPNTEVGMEELRKIRSKPFQAKEANFVQMASLDSKLASIIAPLKSREFSKIWAENNALKMAYLAAKIARQPMRGLGRENKAMEHRAVQRARLLDKLKSDSYTK